MTICLAHKGYKINVKLTYKIIITKMKGEVGVGQLRMVGNSGHFDSELRISGMK